MKTTISPVSPASRHSASLAAYVTGVVGGTLLFSAPQAEAAVTAVSFGFGSVLDITDGSSYTTPTTPNFGTIPRWVSYSSGFMDMPGQHTFRVGESFSQYGHLYQQEVVASGSFGTGLVSFLADGAVVGGGGNGSLGMAYFANTNNPSRDLPTDQLNQNIGFQTTTGNWGWANVSWDATAKALTFNSAYVESVAGNTITVGDTGISAAPEPSRALLALAGLGGVALRRRRKQVA
ncbi:MAG: PEP-CTERM sorting domain-containing protein [Verrucomicrobia bacterium]|nr:PEP-CTERM sorting domain-containing protein [Verrucomicrobiota bacterium]